MSAPNTNIEKQKRRHKAPLIALAIVVLVVIGLMALWIVDLSAEAPGPNGAQAPLAEVPPPGSG